MPPAGAALGAAARMAGHNGGAFKLASPKIAWPRPATHDMP